MSEVDDIRNASAERSSQQFKRTGTWTMVTEDVEDDYSTEDPDNVIDFLEQPRHHC